MKWLLDVGTWFAGRNDMSSLDFCKGLSGWLYSTMSTWKVLILPQQIAISPSTVFNTCGLNV